MDELDFSVFSALLKEAYKKCFGQPLKKPLTEAESKIFCNKILEQTGLSIGWKSVKNYSFFVIDADGSKDENPSLATLDTLARYVLGAPYTNELKRKSEEGHHPYWFMYREKFLRSFGKPSRKKPIVFGIVMGVLIILLIIVYVKMSPHSIQTEYTGGFVDDKWNSLEKSGWIVKSKDKTWWNKRNETPDVLTLFTLKGDNWPDPSSRPIIPNLVLRPIPSGCFTAEIGLSDFVPQQEWQQAGVLLLEDTVLTGKCIRLSLGYNDNFGGKKLPSEIYMQAITSLGNGFGKPEEVAHKPLFYPDSLKKNPTQLENLKNSAFRIEKRDNKFRFLFSCGATENGAFKEVATTDFDMTPRYIGIFAIRGFTNASAMPVHFTFFKIAVWPCNQRPLFH